METGLTTQAVTREVRLRQWKEIIHARQESGLAVNLGGTWPGQPIHYSFPGGIRIICNMQFNLLVFHLILTPLVPPPVSQRTPFY